MTLNVKSTLDAIRNRFVGSGEEHELLRRVCEEYREAYERGAKDRETELFEQARMDTDAVRFARTLSDMTYEARRFISWDGYFDPADKHHLKPTADWLKSIGRTPEQLRALADEMSRTLVE